MAGLFFQFICPSFSLETTRANHFGYFRKFTQKYGRSIFYTQKNAAILMLCTGLRL